MGKNIALKKKVKGKEQVGKRAKWPENFEKNKILKITGEFFREQSLQNSKKLPPAV